MALHKIIRLITATTHAGGYLNFMGNEFGHPEWIDFPREGNQWSHAYARRQWSLVDNPDLKFGQLGEFDRAMTSLLAQVGGSNVAYEYIHQDDMVVSYVRGEYVFVYNFSPTRSFADYTVPAPEASYAVVLDSDGAQYGGFDRVDTSMQYVAQGGMLPLYLPARSALVLKRQS